MGRWTPGETGSFNSIKTGSSVTPDPIKLLASVHNHDVNHNTTEDRQKHDALMVFWSLSTQCHSLTPLRFIAVEPLSLCSCGVLSITAEGPDRVDGHWQRVAALNAEIEAPYIWGNTLLMKLTNRGLSLAVTLSFQLRVLQRWNYWVFFQVELIR